MAPAAAPKLQTTKNMTLTMLQTPMGLSLGVRTDKGIIDVGAAAQAFKLAAPPRPTKSSAVPMMPPHSKPSSTGPERPAANTSSPKMQPSTAPCVTEPSKIICVGLNYRAHAAEANEKLPKEPILFNKFNSALNNHGGTIVVSKEPGKNFDYETELVAVIGKTARNVSEADALSCVFGYCTGQDFSERDQQMRSGQWMLGKTGDGWGPIGPWLVTADQVDPETSL